MIETMRMSSWVVGVGVVCWRVCEGCGAGVKPGEEESGERRGMSSSEIFTTNSRRMMHLLSDSCPMDIVGLRSDFEVTYMWWMASPLCLALSNRL